MMEVEEMGFISHELADKNWKKWAEMGRQKMSIIKELDDWLNHWSESKEKEININDTTIVFTKRNAPLRVNVSVVRDDEITNYNYYMNGEAIKAISILRCLIQIISYHSQSLNNAVDDIKGCMEGGE